MAGQANDVHYAPIDFGNDGIVEIQPNLVNLSVAETASGSGVWNVTVPEGAVAVPEHKNSQNANGIWSGIAMPFSADEYTFYYSKDNDATTPTKAEMAATIAAGSTSYEAKWNKDYDGRCDLDSGDGSWINNSAGAYTGIYKNQASVKQFNVAVVTGASATDAEVTAEKIAAIYHVDQTNVQQAYAVTTTDSDSNGTVGFTATVPTAAGFAASGDTVTMTDTPKTGYEISKVEFDTSGSYVEKTAAPYTFTMGEQAAKIKVTHKAIEYSVSAAEGAVGYTVTPTKAGYTVEETPTNITVSALSGYTFEVASYNKTTDSALNSGKTYYTLSGSTYTAVADPKVENISSYYEATYKAPTAADAEGNAVTLTNWVCTDGKTGTVDFSASMPASDVAVTASVTTTATKGKNPDWTVTLTGMTFTGAELIGELPAKATVTSTRDNGSYGSQYFTFTFWEDEACEAKSLTSLKDAGTYYVKAVANSSFVGKNSAGIDVSYEGQYATGSFTVAKAKMSAVTFRDSAHTAAVAADKISEDFGAFDGNAHAITWMGNGAAATSGITISNVGEVLPILNDGYSLVQGTDFTVTDFKSITDPGSKTVTLTAAGKNFEGSTAIKATVETNTFVTNNSGKDANLKVRTSAMKAAQAVPPTTTASGKGYTAKIDLTDATANAVPFGDSDEPIVVVYGDKAAGTELAPVTDYTVSYKQLRNAKGVDVSATSTATTTAPTDKGIYEATITATNAQRFDLASEAGVASDTLVVTYEIGGGDLTDVAASFEITANGTYLAGQPVVPEKASVKFLDKDGNDVTAKVGTKNFEFAFESTASQDKANELCRTWTSSDEKVQGYVNKKTAATVEQSVAADGTTTYYSYPQGAGDYLITIKGANNYSAAKTLTGKFTVDANKATQGSALGNITVTWPAAAYKGGEAIEYAPKIQMVTAIDKESGEATMTDLLAGDSKNPNFAVSYAQGGKDVELAEIGDYDATIEFGANMAGEAITGKVTVGQGKVSDLLSGFTMKSYTYTGSSIDAEIDSFTAKAEGADTAADAYEYTLAFANGTGTVGADGKPLTAGNYRVTATFSGNYTGTLVGSLTVGKLDWAKAGTDFVVQFEQADGTFDEIYSTTLPASGKAEPAYRVAIADGKQYTDEPTLVNADAIKATYSNNTAQSTTTSKAKMVLSANTDYADNFTGTHAGAEFTITASTFEAAKAALALSATSSKYSATGEKTFTVKVSGTGIGTLTSVTNYSVTVRNSKGETVATVTTQSTEPTITLTAPVAADTYTVVVSTGTDCTYGGLLKATYEVKKLSMEDMTIELTTVTAAEGTTEAAAKVAGFYDKWAIDWAPNTKGIEFTPAEKSLKPTDEPGAYLTVHPSATSAAYLAYGEDKDWTAEYADNKDAGTATITVKGVGNYEGEMTKTFTINQLELPVYEQKTGNDTPGFAIEFTDADVAKKGLAYTGKALEPAFKVVYKNESGAAVAGVKLTDEFTPLYADNTDVYYARTVDTEPSANAVAVVQVDGNYKGELTQSFLITPADFSKADVKAAEGSKYTGETVNPAVTVTVDGNELAAGEKTFTVEYPAASVNAGDYEATVTPAFHGNFAGAAKKAAYTIAKADSTVTVAGKTVTYNGKAVTVEAKATGSTKAPVVKYYSDEKATIALASAPVNAGTYYAKATVEADDNHAAAESAVVKVVINKAASSVKVADVKATYTGKAVAAAATKTGSSAAPVVKYFSDKAATKAISAPVNAGTYYAKATLAADANYAAAESGVATITIAKAANPVKVKAAKKAYKAKAAKKTVFKAKKAFKVTGNKGGKVTYKKANKAGGKKITVSKKGKVTVKKGLKAGAYKVKVKATAKANKNYNKATKSVTLKVKVAKAKK